MCIAPWSMIPTLVCSRVRDACRMVTKRVLRVQFVSVLVYKILSRVMWMDIFLIATLVYERQF